MAISRIEVGEVLENAVGKPEGVIIDVDDSGMQIIVNFYDPAPDEIAQFGQGISFEIKYVVLQKDVLMFTLKIGNLSWMDAPYNPHLSQNLTHDLPNFADGKGLGAILILTDAATGKVVSLRMLGLSEKFSNSLAKEVKNLKNKAFTRQEYDLHLAQIYTKYQTTDIVKLSSERCKI